MIKAFKRELGIKQGKEANARTGGQGFEPRPIGPEPIVLPLDDPPVANIIYRKWGIVNITGLSSAYV